MVNDLLNALNRMYEMISVQKLGPFLQAVQYGPRGTCRLFTYHVNIFTYLLQTRSFSTTNSRRFSLRAFPPVVAQVAHSLVTMAKIFIMRTMRGGLNYLTRGWEGWGGEVLNNLHSVPSLFKHTHSKEWTTQHHCYTQQQHNVCVCNTHDTSTTVFYMFTHLLKAFCCHQSKHSGAAEVS